MRGNLLVLSHFCNGYCFVLCKLERSGLSVHASRYQLEVDRCS